MVRTSVKCTLQLCRLARRRIDASPEPFASVTMTFSAGQLAKWAATTYNGVEAGTKRVLTSAWSSSSNEPALAAVAVMLNEKLQLADVAFALACSRVCLSTMLLPSPKGSMRAVVKPALMEASVVALRSLLPRTANPGTKAPMLTRPGNVWVR